MRPHDSKPPDATHVEPIVAVFDTKTVALRTIAELSEAQLDDFWLAVVRGETHDGETIVAEDGGGEVLLHRALALRGSDAALTSRFDGILPPGTAVISLNPGRKSDEAIRIIEVTGGHIEYL